MACDAGIKAREDKVEKKSKIMKHKQKRRKK
jgi:hypothetical protein